MAVSSESPTVNRLMGRYSDLKTGRSTWESHWQELAEFMFPRRADILVQRIPGQKKMERVVDSTALRAVDALAAALHGMLTSSSVPWFQLGLRNVRTRGDLSDAVKEWLEECERRMYWVFQKSNFDTEVHEVYYDLVVFGTGCLFIEFEIDSGIYFSARPIEEIYIVENHLGFVDTIFRRIKMTPRQCVQKFSEMRGGKISRRIAAVSKTAPDEDIEILHVVMPRLDRDSTKATKKNKPVASYWIDPEEKFMLQEGGFDEFPFMVPRWLKSTGEVYGRSPGMTALPDVKMLNEISRTILKASQKIIDPPIQMPDDGFIGTAKLIPGATNYYRAGTQDRIEPIATGANIPVGFEIEQARREAVMKTFYVDQLQMPQEGPQMTATEILARSEDRMRMLGPVMGRMHAELLGPLIDRVFNMMMREGAFPPPPAELRGKAIDIEYVSPMARAQRGQVLTQTVQWLELMVPLAQFLPVMNVLNAEKFVRWSASIKGVPEEVLNSPDEVAQMQAAQQGQQAQAAQMMEMQAGAATAKDAASAAKDANVDLAKLLKLPSKAA